MSSGTGTALGTMLPGRVGVVVSMPVLGTKELILPLICHFSPPMHRALRENGPGSLACAVYTRDFGPTRVRTREGYGVFHMTTDVETPGGRNRAWYLPRFRSAVVGEVDMIGNMCPSNAVCSAAAFFSEQMRVLRGVLRDDEKLVGGTVVGSWLDMSTVNSAWTAVEECFYVGIERSHDGSLEWDVGDTGLFTLAMERRDHFGVIELERVR
ncbi:hypothetical protein B0H11DRAFT_2295205 [Mycena galericulata]|nr:hypothetical protein B0H11DRAFT_2295205 [Mycena galericulata]